MYNEFPLEVCHELYGLLLLVHSNYFKLVSKPGFKLFL